MMRHSASTMDWYSCGSVMRSSAFSFSDLARGALVAEARALGGRDRAEAAVRAHDARVDGAAERVRAGEAGDVRGCGGTRDEAPPRDRRRERLEERAVCPGEDARDAADVGHARGHELEVRGARAEPELQIAIVAPRHDPAVGEDHVRAVPRGGDAHRVVHALHDDCGDARGGPAIAALAVLVAAGARAQG